MTVAQRGENTVRMSRAPPVTTAKGIQSLPVPDHMRLPTGPAGTEPVHHNQSEPNDPIEVRVISTDKGVGDLLVRRNTGEEMAARCHILLRTMPKNSQQARDMRLRKTFYEECGGEVVFDLSAGTMSAPDEVLRKVFLWYRDTCKLKLSPEQEAFMGEDA